MERIAVERNNLTACVIVAAAAVAAFVLICVIVTMFTEWNNYYFVILVMLLFFAPMTILALFSAYSVARPGMKEIMIIDDNGLLIKGNAAFGPTAEDFGPIPWDCICGAETVRISFGRYLNVYLTNTSKMKTVFGEETMREKFGTRRRPDDMVITIDPSICKLKGIDLEALIRERATGKV